MEIIGKFWKFLQKMEKNGNWKIKNKKIKESKKNKKSKFQIKIFKKKSRKY